MEPSSHPVDEFSPQPAKESNANLTGESSSVPAEESSPKYASESNTLPAAESSPLPAESSPHSTNKSMPSQLENLALCLLRSPASSLPMIPKLSKLQSPVLCLQNPAPFYQRIQCHPVGEPSSLPAEESSPQLANDSKTLQAAESSPLPAESSPHSTNESNAIPVGEPSSLPAEESSPQLAMIPKLSKLQSPVLCLQNPAPILPTINAIPIGEPSSLPAEESSPQCQ